jgi:hypothetical protein
MIWLIVPTCLIAFTFFRLGALSVLVTVLTTAIQMVLNILLVFAPLSALRAVLRSATRK